MLDPVTLARAILEAGAKGVDEVNQEIRDLEVSLIKLGTAYEQGQFKITEYAHKSARLRGEIERLKAGLSAAESALSLPANSTAGRDGQTLIPSGFLAQTTVDRPTGYENVEAARQKEEAADREASRLSNALGASVDSAILDSVERGENSLRSSVRSALAKAGVAAEEIGELTTRVADKLSAWVNNNLNERVLKVGTTNAEARTNRVEAATEPNPKSNPQSSNTSTIDSKVLSDKQYLDRMLVAGFSSPAERDKIPARQLDEQKNTNRKLENLTRAVMDKNRQGDVARFARGRT
ncbi:hypothetical protein V5E97_10145 [Singulisphaera sp. Ch08]|uniref:Uncharacterized protein n=1 Tax=Singulisphaera sp. Ch08 TaxID=3120278 RepID=A0AAU7CM38_9BACT